MKLHVITTDITAAAYSEFAETMLGVHAEFSLVWRDQLDFSDKAARVRTDLIQLELRAERTVRWPGTRLLKGAGVATVA